MNHSPHNLPGDVQQLQALLLTERQQREELIHQLAASDKQAEAVASHLETIARQSALIDTREGTIQQYLRKIAGLQKQLEKLLRRSYGPQRERIDPNQLMLFTEEELQQVANDLTSGVKDSVPADDGSEVAPNEDGSKVEGCDRSGLHGSLSSPLVGREEDRQSPRPRGLV